MARVLGATYGRLQSELLTPLVLRAVTVLQRRGEIPDLAVDGQFVDLQYTAPLARNQARLEAKNTVLWLQSLKSRGPQALNSVATDKAARWLAHTYGVPDELVNEEAMTQTVNIDAMVPPEFLAIDDQMVGLDDQPGLEATISETGAELPDMAQGIGDGG